MPDDPRPSQQIPPRGTEVDRYAQYKILFDADPYPAFIFDRETLRFLLVNEAALDQYGYSFDEFLSMRVTDIRPPDTVDEFLSHMQSPPEHRNRPRGLWRHQTKGGRELQVEVSGYDFEFGGRFARLARVVDVTDRQIAEDSVRTTESRLRLQNRAIIELTRRHSLRPDDLTDTIRAITETTARILDAHRVSVWRFVEAELLRCSDAFDARSRSHRDGAELEARENLRLIEALADDGVIAADDARGDPRTAEFAAARGLDGSAIVSAIRQDGLLAGFIEVESLGSRRHWFTDEENFAGSMSDLIAMALEASERHRTEILLRDRLAFENLVTAISSRFVRVTSEEIHDAIDDVLKRVGEFAKVDRTYVYTLADDATEVLNTNEWCADGIAPHGEILGPIDLTRYPFWKRELGKRETLVINSVAGLPDSAALDRTMALERGAKSILVVPMICGQKLVGSLGCSMEREERDWSADTVALMQIIAEILANAIVRSRTQQALHEGEERYRLVFERNLAGVFRSTPAGDVLECNAACARIFGFDSPEALKENHAVSLYFDVEHRERYLAQLREKGQLTNFQIQMRRRDGSPVWVMENVTILPAPPGGTEVIEGTMIDITEWKSVNESLRKSEENFRILLEQMRDGVLRVDKDDVIEYANSRFCDIVGYDADELIGRRLLDFLIFPADRPLLEAKSASRVHGVSDRYQIRIYKKSGEIAWLEVGGSPVTDSSGKTVGSIGVITDITERKRANDALRESEARYRLMADNSTDLISRHGPDSTYLYASPAALALTGYTPEELVGRPFQDFIFRDDVREVEKCHTRVLTLAASSTVTYRLLRKDGKQVWFETTGRAVRDETGNVSEIIAVTRDITDRRLVEEQIEYRAYHDALTGLPNRELFKDRLNVALAHARRLKSHVAVLFLDLDHFKLVNDTFGHSTGDRLLQEVAERISLAIREEDTVARMGGDEFTLLVSDLGHEPDAVKIARKLLESIAAPMNIEGHELYITTSVGISMFPADGDDAEALLKNADTAMYRAKELGRNNYQLCTPSLTRRALHRLSLENNLRHALDHDEMVVYYQPQFRLETGRIVGFEALVRWKHPEKGIVGPGEFIAIAEESRLIVPLGEWVLETAARQAKKWQDMYGAPLRLAVNLSPRQFQQKDLGRAVERVLSVTGLPAATLELEITETTAMQSTHHTVATLRTLKEIGLAIAIDDFGTGHSSLNYLKRFPIDTIKIDRSFVQDVFTGGSDAAIVSAVIALAHGLRLRVIAEGVETEDQLQFLRDHLCEEMQGYLYCKPLPALDIDRLIESGVHSKMKVQKTEVEN